jgi:signal transduction histidine kinase
MIFRLLLFLSFFSSVTLGVAQKDSLLRIIKRSKDKDSLISAYPSLSFVMHLSKPDSALELALKGIRLADSLGDQNFVGSGKNMAGLAYFRKGWYNASLKSYNESLEIFTALNMPDQLARVHQNMGHVFQAQRNYTEALKHGVEAIKYYEVSKDSFRLGSSFQTLSIITREMKDFASSMNYINESCKILIKLNAYDELANSYTVKGNLYVAMKKYNEGLLEFNKAIQLYDKTDDLLNKAITYENIGSTYLELNDLNLSIQYYNRAIDIFANVGSYVDVAYERMLRSKPYQLINKNKEALNDLIYADSVFSSEKLNDYLADLYKYRSEYHQETGDLSNALKFFQKHVLLKDSLNEANNKDQLLRLQAEFESEKKEKQISLLEAETAVKDAKLSQRNWIILAFAILFITGIYLWFNFRKKQALKQELKKQQLLNKISSDLHDDLGASLSSIRMYGEMLKMQGKEKAPELMPLAEKISDNSKELIQTMSDIVWAIKPGNSTLSELQDKIWSTALEICKSRNIELNFNKADISEGLSINADWRNDVYLICKEGLNNAMKYSGSSSIVVEIEFKHQKFSVTIADKGVGFNPNNIKGNGLRNMQQRSERLNGEFKLITAPNQGCNIQFSVSVV